MRLKSTLLILLVAATSLTCNAFTAADTGESLELLTVNDLIMETPGTAIEVTAADTSVTLEDFNYAENEYSDGTNIWSALKLHKAAQGLVAFDVPLASINLSGYPWGEQINTNSLIFHFKRIQEADLNFPIIYDDEGIIADGWHRICKAILEKRQTIKAVRLNKMPEPDRAEQV